MLETCNLTGELSCVITLLINFPSSKNVLQLGNTKFYVDWATEFTKGSSAHIKLDSKGDLSQQFTFKTLCQGTSNDAQTTINSFCSMQLMKIPISGKPKAIGSQRVSLTEGFKILTAPHHAQSVASFTKVTYFYLDSAKDKKERDTLEEQTTPSPARENLTNSQRESLDAVDQLGVDRTNEILVRASVSCSMVNCRINNDFYAMDKDQQWSLIIEGHERFSPTTPRNTSSALNDSRQRGNTPSRTANKQGESETACDAGDDSRAGLARESSVDGWQRTSAVQGGTQPTMTPLLTNSGTLPRGFERPSSVAYLQLSPRGRQNNKSEVEKDSSLPPRPNTERIARPEKESTTTATSTTTTTATAITSPRDGSHVAPKKLPIPKPKPLPVPHSTGSDGQNATAPVERKPTVEATVDLSELSVVSLDSVSLPPLPMVKSQSATALKGTSAERINSKREKQTSDAIVDLDSATTTANTSNDKLDGKKSKSSRTVKSPRGKERSKKYKVKDKNRERDIEALRGDMGPLLPQVVPKVPEPEDTLPPPKMLFPDGESGENDASSLSQSATPEKTQTRRDQNGDEAATKTEQSEEATKARKDSSNVSGTIGRNSPLSPREDTVVSSLMDEIDSMLDFASSKSGTLSKKSSPIPSNKNSPSTSIPTSISSSSDMVSPRSGQFGSKDNSKNSIRLNASSGSNTKNSIRVSPRAEKPNQSIDSFLNNFSILSTSSQSISPEVKKRTVGEASESNAEAEEREKKQKEQDEMLARKRLNSHIHRADMGDEISDLITAIVNDRQPDHSKSEKALPKTPDVVVSKAHEPVDSEDEDRRNTVARLEAERVKREQEEKRLETERRKNEENLIREMERKRVQEREMLHALLGITEKDELEADAKKQEEDRRRDELKKRDEERQRLEEEKRVVERKKAEDEERKRKEEKERKDLELKQLEDEKKQIEERIRMIEEKERLAEERKREEAERVKREEELERKQREVAEQKRKEDEEKERKKKDKEERKKRRAEEKAQRAEEKRKQEEAEKLRKIEEEKKEAERKQKEVESENLRKIEEERKEVERKRKEEMIRIMEEKELRRKEEEKMREIELCMEELRMVEESADLEQQRQQDEENRRREEEERAKEEQREREIQRCMEELRLEEERALAEAEAKRRSEEEARRKLDLSGVRRSEFGAVGMSPRFSEMARVNSPGGVSPRRVEMSPRRSEAVPVSPRSEARLLREREAELRRIEEVKRKAEALRKRLEQSEEKKRIEALLTIQRLDEIDQLQNELEAEAGYYEDYQENNNNTNDEYYEEQYSPRDTTGDLGPGEEIEIGAETVLPEEENAISEDENDELTILLNNAISQQQHKERYEKFLVDLRAAFSSVLQMVISFEMNHSQVDLLKEIAMTLKNVIALKELLVTFETECSLAIKESLLEYISALNADCMKFLKDGSVLVKQLPGSYDGGVAYRSLGTQKDKVINTLRRFNAEFRVKAKS